MLTHVGEWSEPGSVSKRSSGSCTEYAALANGVLMLSTCRSSQLEETTLTAWLDQALGVCGRNVRMRE